MNELSKSSVSCLSIQKLGIQFLEFIIIKLLIAADSCCPQTCAGQVTFVYDFFYPFNSCVGLVLLTLFTGGEIELNNLNKTQIVKNKPVYEPRFFSNYKTQIRRPYFYSPLKIHKIHAQYLNFSNTEKD